MLLPSCLVHIFCLDSTRNLLSDLFVMLVLLFGQSLYDVLGVSWLCSFFGTAGGLLHV